MSRRSPNKIDAHVGHRIRVRRTILGITQENLSERLGVTFQQVQKYERGINRISAGRLYEVSKVLVVPVQYFFDGLETDNGQSPNGSGLEEAPGDKMADWEEHKRFLESVEGMRLIQNFLQIADPSVRSSVMALLKQLASSSQADVSALSDAAKSAKSAKDTKDIKDTKGTKDTKGKGGS